MFNKCVSMEELNHAYQKKRKNLTKNFSTNCDLRRYGLKLRLIEQSYAIRCIFLNQQ